MQLFHRDMRSFQILLEFESDVQIRFDSKLTGRFENFEFFTISRLYVHISQKLLKIEAYKQRGEKSFISPLSNCRMCLDPSVTGFYRVSQKVSDVIPVLRLTPIGTQPSAVSVFLSVAKCGGLQSHMQGIVGHRPAHILAQSHPLWQRGSKGWAKSSKNIRILDHFQPCPLYLSDR